VGGWTTRVGKKLADLLDDHTLSDRNASMLQQFKNISILVHQQLQGIFDRRAEDQTADDSDESLNVKELITDFATDEFVSKNVRVRPTSSMSGGVKDQSEIGGPRSSTHGGRDDEEDEKKFNTET
jgi:hypothetical protein